MGSRAIKFSLLQKKMEILMRPLFLHIRGLIPTTTNVSLTMELTAREEKEEKDRGRVNRHLSCGLGVIVSE